MANNTNILGLLLFSQAIHFGCGNISKSASQQQSKTSHGAIQQQSKINHGFYVFDGTRQSEKSKNIMYRLAKASKSAKSTYLAGSRRVVLGQDAVTIKRRAMVTICKEIDAGQVTKVNLAGYSRGAMIALAIAKDLEKNGCETKDSVKVNWIGLVDAVNSGLTRGRWTSQVPTGTPCFHVRKARRWEGFFTTKTIKGCEVQKFAGKHGSFKKNNEAALALVSSAEEQGFPGIHRGKFF